MITCECDLKQLFLVLLSIKVLCSALMCKAVDIPDLLDRASQRSDKLHSLSNMLAKELVSTCTRLSTHSKTN